MAEIFMAVATHKKFDVVVKDSSYKTIQVGAALSNELFDNMYHDNDGNFANISDKNRQYCELTALYWMWKNQELEKIDYFGLSHYRRYFLYCTGNAKKMSDDILDSESTELLMQKYKVILPLKSNKPVQGAARIKNEKRQTVDCNRGDYC